MPRSRSKAFQGVPSCDIAFTCSRSSAPHWPHPSPDFPPDQRPRWQPARRRRPSTSKGDTAEINNAAAVIFDASAGLLEQASPIYIIEFPVAPGTTGPITLPSGYQPQHNGFPPSPIPYHDHVLTSAPGLATSGTPGDYMAPLRVVAMRYSRTYAYSPAFVPITSAEQIPGAEANGELERINPGAPDPYQVWTTTVLVRPVLPGR
jgi:hypothetical protein